jgi:hypothetical protein
LSRFELRPSVPLAAAVVLAHGAAGAASWLVLGGAMGLALAGAFVALGIAVAWRRALLRSPQSVRSIEAGERGEVVLELARGERLSAAVAERRYVSRWMVTLPVRRPARQTILVTRGMLGEAAFRRLRLWALWGKVPGALRPR